MPDPYTDELYPQTEPTPEPKGVLSTWKIYSLADAYREQEPLTYLVGRMFEMPSLNAVWGAPGSLKSMWMAYIACCVAGGKPCMPPLPGTSSAPLSVTPGPVCWLDYDNGARRTHDRIGAMARALNLPADAPLHYVSMSTPWLDLRNKAMVGELGEIIKGYGALLTVIDNLGTVSGGANENDSEMLPIMAHLAWLREYSKGIVTFVHHPRKGNGFKTRKGENMRGFGGIEQMCDLALLVERPDEHKTDIVISSSKTRGTPVSPFGATFAYENRPDGSLLTAGFFGTDANSSELVTIATIRAAILESLQDGEEVKKGELAARTQANLSGIGENRVIGVINLLIEEGVLTARYGPRNAQLIRKNGCEEAE